MQDQGSTVTAVDGVVWGRPVSRGGLVRVGALRAGGEDSGGLGGGDVATTAIFVVKGGGRLVDERDGELGPMMRKRVCLAVIGTVDGVIADSQLGHRMARRGEEQDLGDLARPPVCSLDFRK